MPTEVARAATLYEQRRAERERFQSVVKDRAERLHLELGDAYRTSRDVRLRDLELRAFVDAAGIDVAEAIGDAAALTVMPLPNASP